MFVIQDRATGGLLPSGGSSAEFSRDKAPRLFRRRGDAANALNCWRMGLWYNDIDQYGEGSGPVPYDNERNRTLAAKRQAMNLHVVPVRLEVLG